MIARSTHSEATLQEVVVLVDEANVEERRVAGLALPRELVLARPGGPSGATAR